MGWNKGLLSGLMTDAHSATWRAGPVFGVLCGTATAVWVWFVDDWANHPWWSNGLKSLGFFVLWMAAGPVWGLLTWRLRQWVARRNG